MAYETAAGSVVEREHPADDRDDGGTTDAARSERRSARAASGRRGEGELGEDDRHEGARHEAAGDVARPVRCRHRLGGGEPDHQPGGGGDEPPPGHSRARPPARRRARWSTRSPRARRPGRPGRRSRPGRTARRAKWGTAAERGGPRPARRPRPSRGRRAGAWPAGGSGRVRGRGSAAPARLAAASASSTRAGHVSSSRAWRETATTNAVRWVMLHVLHPVVQRLGVAAPVGRGDLDPDQYEERADDGEHEDDSGAPTDARAAVPLARPPMPERPARGSTARGEAGNGGRRPGTAAMPRTVRRACSGAR